MQPKLLHVDMCQQPDRVKAGAACWSAAGVYLEEVGNVRPSLVGNACEDLRSCACLFDQDCVSHHECIGPWLPTDTDFKTRNTCANISIRILR